MYLDIFHNFGHLKPIDMSGRYKIWM